ncbi:hypothetical protein C3V36_04480 [Lachnospiraceae bacterium oral taxon 500]|nr:hypothetical protein C3V36_04480 [Lachnospiraceae bacterium oral taxon 500]
MESIYQSDLRHREAVPVLQAVYHICWNLARGYLRGETYFEAGGSFSGNGEKGKLTARRHFLLTGRRGLYVFKWNELSLSVL